MNADGMPSLWVHTVCVYSARGLLGSDASDWSARRTQHAAAQNERIRLAAGKDRMSHARPILLLSITLVVGGPGKPVYRIPVDPARIDEEPENVYQHNWYNIYPPP